MDPYLEGPAHWSDFHSTFIHALREALADRLPEPYFARIDELVMMVAPETGRAKAAGPDVTVGRDALTLPGASTGQVNAGPGAGMAVLEPTTLSNVDYVDPVTEPFVEIVRLPDRKLVTVIELLSPTNKYGEGRGLYAEKRRRLLRTDVNVVEIDLLRAGPRLALSRPLPPDHYYAFVSRGDRRPFCDVYHWSVRQAMPVLPIPLLPPDPDLKLSLAEPFETAFHRGRYDRFIDYREPPPAPAFGTADRSWVAGKAANAAR